MIKKSLSLVILTTTFLFGNITKEEIKIKKQIIPNGKYYTDESVRNVIKKEQFFANKFLKEFGETEKAKIAIKLAKQEVLAKLYREKLKEKFIPNEEAIKSFYIDNKEEFAPSTTISLSVITLKNIDIADKVYKELKKNPDKFKEIAKKYSLDNHIDYKDVSIAIVAPQVRAWVRKAKVGEISEPFKVGKMFFIDKLNDKKTIQPTYENLKPELKTLLQNIYINKKLEQLYIEEGKK